MPSKPRGVPTLVWKILFVGVLVLLFSLGHMSRQHTTYRAERGIDYLIHTEKNALGAPWHWLNYNVVTVIAKHPGNIQEQVGDFSGFSLSWFGFCGSLVFSLVLSAAFVVSSRMAELHFCLNVPSKSDFFCLLLLSIIPPFIATFSLAATIASACLIPVLVIWVARKSLSYFVVAFCSLFSGLSIWWGQQMQMFLVETRPRVLSLSDFLEEVALLTGLCLLVVIPFTAIFRWLKESRCVFRDNSAGQTGINQPPKPG